MALIEKEVYFDQWCASCKHKDLEEDQEPCHWCLQQPWNANSHRPVYYEGTRDVMSSKARPEANS